jgi:type VII secretion protein EccE
VPHGRIPGAQSAVPEQISRWRLNLGVRFVVIAELCAAAVVVAAAAAVWWAAALAAGAAALVVTLTYNGATAAGWVFRAARFWRHRRSAAARRKRAAVPAPFTAELPGTGPAGLRWDGKYVVTMIELHGRAFAPTVLVPAGADTTDTVSLEAISALLHQFAALELDCVDVVSVSQRVAADGRYTPKYDEIIGDRPAVGQRRTWLVVRLCPQACMAAIAYRGDAAAAAAAATERIRQAVLRTGCRAVTCTAEQLGEATEALLAGKGLSRVGESWSHADLDADYVTSYRIAGSDLLTRTLNDVCTVRSKCTVQTIRLTADRAGQGVSVGAVVRFHTAAPLTHPPLLALRPVTGQSFDALAASLPLGDRSLRLGLSSRRLADDLAIPVGPSGPLLGMTVTGFPFLMPITDPLRTVRMSVDARLPVVIPLLLRASAAGAVILVHSDRPTVWEPVCDDQRILLAGDTEPRRTPNVIVVDGAGQEITGGERGHTVVVLTDTAQPDCDITIAELSGDDLVINTASLHEVRLAIMRPRNEAEFVAHLRTAAVTP